MKAGTVTVPPLQPARLRCAHRVNPLGVDPDRVRLSWELHGAGASRVQRAYQVLVTPGEEATARGGVPAGGADPVWDSGMVESSASADIEYAGSPLARGGRYTWRVRVWDENLSRWD